MTKRLHVNSLHPFRFFFPSSLLKPLRVDQHLLNSTFPYFLFRFFFFSAGSCAATVSKMAVWKWFHVYNVVSFGSHQFRQHRTRETIPIQVSRTAKFIWKAHGRMSMQSHAIRMHTQNAAMRSLCKWSSKYAASSVQRAPQLWQKHNFLLVVFLLIFYRHTTVHFWPSHDKIEKRKSRKMCVRVRAKQSNDFKWFVENHSAKRDQKTKKHPEKYKHSSN